MRMFSLPSWGRTGPFLLAIFAVVWLRCPAVAGLGQLGLGDKDELGAANRRNSNRDRKWGESENEGHR